METGEEPCGATVSVVVLRALLDTLESMDIASSALLDQIGIGPEALVDRADRLPIATMLRAWELAAKLADDDAIGLHFGESVAMGSFGVLDFLTRSCDTLHEALERVSQFQRLMNSAVQVSLEVDGDTAEFRYRVDAAPTPGVRHTTEASLSIYITRARTITGINLAPLAVRFAHPEPRDVSEHSRIFRAPISFGHEVSTLVFGRCQLAVPLRTAEPCLHQILNEHAEATLERIPAESPVTSRAAAAVAATLATAGPSLAAVARRLQMTSRTLQRRLADEGTNFKDLVDWARHSLAVQYLEVDNLTIKEISYRLGFSEPSAFHRAFRRWTGSTPARVRASTQ